MRRPATLGQKLVGGMIQAFGEHLVESSPELRQIAHAFGYTAALPPSRARQHAEEKVGEVAGEAAAGAAERLGRRIAAGRRRDPSDDPAAAVLRRKMDAIMGQLTPRERKIIEQRLKKRGAEDDVIELVRRPDGSYGEEGS